MLCSGWVVMAWTWLVQDLANRSRMLALWPKRRRLLELPRKVAANSVLDGGRARRRAGGGGHGRAVPGRRPVALRSGRPLAGDAASRAPGVAPLAGHDGDRETVRGALEGRAGQAIGDRTVGRLPGQADQAV